MLHIDGREDIYPGIQQLLDILPAFGMACAGDIAVRQLIHQYHGRSARQHAIEIEFRQPAATVEMVAHRLHRQTVEQCGGLGAAVGLDDTDQDIQPLCPQTLGFLQHGVGLADTGIGAEEDLQLAAVSGLGQQAIRVGSANRISDHVYSVVAWARALRRSSIRFRRSTLTTGLPRSGRSTSASTRAVSTEFGNWRAAATRGTW